MKKEIPIFFAIDNDYVQLVSIAIKSIIDNSSKIYNYKIIILHQGVEEENKEAIKELEQENLKIEFVSMSKGLETITDREENKLRCDYFTLTIYYRLFIPEMFPKYDKAIYIDSDVVVPGDISRLYNTDLEGNIIGACTDNSIVDIKEFVDYVQEAVGVNVYNYINSGVLLMDTKQMRERKFTNKFLELLNTYHFDSVAPDQDYINAICKDKIKYLNEEWDAMPNDKRKPIEAPKLIHYNLFFKPWLYDNIQYEEYFWRYAKETPYYEYFCNIKENYSDTQKEIDSKCLENMLMRAVQITEKEEITFNKLYNKGEKIRL